MTFYQTLPLNKKEIESIGISLNSQTQSLFIQDPIQTNLYHPQILVNQKLEYQNLDPFQQKAFNDLQINYFYQRHIEF